MKKVLVLLFSAFVFLLSSCSTEDTIETLSQDVKVPQYVIRNGEIIYCGEDLISKNTNTKSVEDSYYYDFLNCQNKYTCPVEIEPHWEYSVHCQVVGQDYSEGTVSFFSSTGMNLSFVFTQNGQEINFTIINDDDYSYWFQVGYEQPSDGTCIVVISKLRNL